jgi:3-phenylpropionate/cinnamic acid dioxygenase small subunit
MHTDGLSTDDRSFDEFLAHFRRSCSFALCPALNSGTKPLADAQPTRGMSAEPPSPRYPDRIQAIDVLTALSVVADSGPPCAHYVGGLQAAHSSTEDEHWHR